MYVGLTEAVIFRYWLYGDCVLDETRDTVNGDLLDKEGSLQAHEPTKRHRGWFPRSCVVPLLAFKEAEDITREETNYTAEDASCRNKEALHSDKATIDKTGESPHQTEEYLITSGQVYNASTCNNSLNDCQDEDPTHTPEGDSSSLRKRKH